MPIKIHYRGLDLEFEKVPTSAELEAHHRAQTGPTEIVLPVGEPPPLERLDGPFSAEPLDGALVYVGSSSASCDQGQLKQTIGRLGGRCTDRGSDANRFVFDATPVASVRDLEALYEFLHLVVGALPRNARVVIIRRPVGASPSDDQAAGRQAIDGVIRSLPSELGRFGATINLLTVDEGTEGNLGSPLGFLLSHRSSFVTGQELRVTGIEPSAGEPASTVRTGLNALVSGAGPVVDEIRRRLALEGAQILAISGSDTTDKPEVFGWVKQRGGLDVVIHVGEPRTQLTEALREESLLNPDVALIWVASLAGLVGARDLISAAESAMTVGAALHFDRVLGGAGRANSVLLGFIDGCSTCLPEGERRLNALRQPGTVVDVANAVGFLALPAARGIRGQTLRVCGGYLRGR